jgi:hypothetical protein
MIFGKDRWDQNCQSLRMHVGDNVCDDSRQHPVIGLDNIKLGPSVGLASVHDLSISRDIRIDEYLLFIQARIETVVSCFCHDSSP